MSGNIQKKEIDITGVELTPGEPTVCLGNGEQGFECCCDECDYYLLCFPEFDSKKEGNINENNLIPDNHIKKDRERKIVAVLFLSLGNIFY